MSVDLTERVGYIWYGYTPQPVDIEETSSDLQRRSAGSVELILPQMPRWYL